MYYEKTSPKEVKNGLKAKSKRGSIGETWWSKRWVSVLESFDMGARLTRGKSYARKGQVISIDVEPGVVKARVQGSFPKPYDVLIKLVPLSPEEWDRAIAAMASKAVFSACSPARCRKQSRKHFPTVAYPSFPRRERI